MRTRFVTYDTKTVLYVQKSPKCINMKVGRPAFQKIDPNINSPAKQNQVKVSLPHVKFRASLL